MKKTLFALLMLSALATIAADYRIEPEFFTNLKSWRKSLDKNTSGRCQLISDQIADNDLTETLQLPEGGLYHLWVRSFSFGENARRFKLYVNDKFVGTYGDAPIPQGEPKPTLRWDKAAETMTLPKGTLAIRVVPLSKYSRIDALLLSTNAAFVPSNSATDFRPIPELKIAPDTTGKPPKKITYPKPDFKGRGEPVLILCGGRPWTGAEFGGFLSETGVRTRTLNSKHLAGFGGAPIRDMLDDAFEPEPEDYITTEFAAIDSYKAVVINNIPADKQAAMLTPARVAILKKYVENGGKLFLTIHAPETLNDLLPVTVLPGKVPSKGVTAQRPAGENFAFLPATWPIFDHCKCLQAKQGAVVLSTLVDEKGQAVTPYIVTKTIGKGQVLFFNGSYNRLQQVASLYAWAYGRAFMAAMLKELTGLPIIPAVLVRKEAPCPAPKNLDTVNTTIRPAVMTLADTAGKVTVQGNTIRFADGATLTIDAQGAVALTMPGASKPYAKDMKPPKLMMILTQHKLTSSTSEAVDMNQKSISNTTWIFKRATADGSRAILHYTADNGAVMEWIFKSGTIQIDERLYNGIAQKAKILSAPSLVNSLSCDYMLDIDATFCRRMNCYQPPRGYVDIDVSGAVNADTKRCGFFVNSQPFGYINTRNGIFAEIVERPLPTEVRFMVKQGDKAITANSTQLIGRRAAPVEGEFLWHLYSHGAEQGHNDYIALWQFARHILRRSAGLKEVPMYPCAGYTNTAHGQEIDKAIEAAAKLGVTYMHLPLCPSAINSLDSAKNMAIYAKIKACGMKSYPWTAGDYTHGTGDVIFQQHKDWLMRDEKGGIYAYFNNFRVIDLGHPEFIQWYFKKLKRVFEAGAGYIYMDMGGQAASNVNFAGKESKPGLLNQIPIFKFHHDNGILCGVEGMNPLVIDNYWYREKLYVPMGGKEFAALGANLGTNEDASFVLRYFRTAMYGAMTRFHTDAYAQNFERVPGEIDTINHIGCLLPGITAALDGGMPFIRQTEYGTTWISDRGGAVFVWDNVKKLNLKLPKGYAVVKTLVPDGKMRDFRPDDLEDIASETIFVLGKKLCRL